MKSSANVAASDTDSATANLLVSKLIGFVHLMRTNGFEVGIPEGLDVLRVAERISVTDRQRMRWGLRSLLCGNAEEWLRFDALFDAYWLPPNRKVESVFVPQPEHGGRQRAEGRGAGSADVDQGEAGDDGDAGESGARGGASARETDTKTDFMALSEALRMQEMERMVERLARRMRRRVVRRQRIARLGRRVHLRRTIRHSLRYGGTPLELVFTRRRRELPRLVLLLDVSRSMSLYSYVFLRFARGLVGVFADAHAFVFHTRLIPVTEVLRERNVEQVKEKLAVMSLGWGGGTRIGESVEVFNQQYARKLLNARSIFVMMSDGFDTGEPQLLAEQMRQIRRRARKIVWLNPLLGREGYEPTAGGMKAALPFVDVFASAHNFESLMALESQLAAM